MVSSTPRPHFTLGKDPVPILQEAGWAPGPVWTGAENLVSTGNRSRTVQPASSVAIPTELPSPQLPPYLQVKWQLIIRRGAKRKLPKRRVYAINITTQCKPPDDQFWFDQCNHYKSIRSRSLWSFETSGTTAQRRSATPQAPLMISSADSRTADLSALTLCRRNSFFNVSTFCI